MRKSIALLLAIAGLLVVAFAALAPASLAGPRLARISNGTLTLVDAEGTLWRGRGIVVAGAGSGIPLAWTADPWRLARGEIAVTLLPYAPNAQSPHMEIVADDGHVSLSNVGIEFPAAFVASAYGGGNARGTPVIGGNLRITSPSFTWAADAGSGGINALWHGARIAPGGDIAPIDLGNVQAALAAQGNAIGGPVTNSGGDVDIRGELGWTRKGGFATTLMLTPRRADDAVLQRTLSAIGAPEGAGYRIAWRSPPR